MPKSIDPFTEKLLKDYPYHQEAEIKTRLEKAQLAFPKWKSLSFEKRASYLKKISQLLIKEKAGLSLLMTQEMGKPITQSRQEIEKCALACDYYAENAENFLAPEFIKTEIKESRVVFEPLGIILAIMPWNFPFWQVFRFLAPTLMAGNVAVLKHASNVTGCALAIEALLQNAGLPEGVFNLLIVPVEKIPAIISQPSIKGVTLTGSSEAGRRVGELAGRSLKKCVLELGGSDPFIILEDADLELALNTAVKSRMTNNGQSCIAAKRFIVQEKIYEDFMAKLTFAMKEIKLGDPSQEETQLGPLAKEGIRLELDRQVKQSLQKGARLILGGKLPEGKGYFYPPTILDNIPQEASLYDEESFGPVASCFKFKEDKEAIHLANDTAYGLASTIFSKDKERALWMASQLETGACFINKQVRSDPRLPFGGVKDSGFGRELSDFGIKEFTNIKTLYPKF